MCAKQTEEGWTDGQASKMPEGFSIPYLSGTHYGKRQDVHTTHRVEAIRNHVSPVTKKDVQSFLGTTGYYKKFILNYAHNSIELTNVTWKSAPNVVYWSTAMNDEFYNLCHTLSQVSSLPIPTPKDTFILQTDTSTKGIAGILNVVRAGEELPVGFYSRKLHPAEARYSATEIECLAIVRSNQHFGV